MTKREQLFGILNKHFGYSTAIHTTAEISYQLEKINECIESIIALPLDMPTEKKVIMKRFKKFIREQHPALNISWVADNFIKTNY